jgi:hypothetical protein
MSNRSKEIFVLIFILLAAIVTVDILDEYQPNTPIIPIILWLVFLIGIGGVVRVITKYANKN